MEGEAQLARAMDAAEVMVADSKRTGDGSTDGSATRRSKKGKKGRRNGGNGSTASGGLQAEPQPQEMVAVSPLAPNSEILQVGPRPVMLSKVEKAPQMVLGEDRLSVTSHKGYRMVRATHGAHEGTWYYEVHVQHLGTTGHVRVGWATRNAELQAPVGYDAHGYSYRDLEGSKVHKGLRDEYGEAYREGDVIGCLLHLPLGGRPFLRTRNDAGSYKGNLYLREEPAEEAPPRQLEEATVTFSRNGVSQSVAYRDLVEATYFPAVSLYTLPEQPEGATLSVNFGPDFAHPPPELEGLPAARPISDLPALEQEELAAAAAAAAVPDGGDDPAQQQQGGGAATAGADPSGPDQREQPPDAAGAAHGAAEGAVQNPSDMQTDGR